MWSWFSGASAQRRKDGPKNAILLLRQQLDMLQKREKHLENQMNEQEAIARKNLATNKAAAKTALRRKKVHERSLQQTSDQINQVEQQIYSIESANINQETLNAMKTAGKAMKEIHGNLTIDKVDATMEELREQHALGEEIANAISSPPIGEPIDEDDLEAELEGMEQEAIDERMLKTGTVPVADLPGVANGPIKGKNKVQQEEEDEEEELRKLQAEMAM
ncbi:ESCRT-III subunit protein snf7 [Endocarpon pusillum]|uniref:Vacuolar-sorting protein SNF7 n=1 Tax=Endocarpon pusillum TaxID=364733 RepID=A0A8H7ASB1_9EURO|nr:ESCRT-III subunit protein snf7 [Endocarpon pusillum]